MAWVSFSSRCIRVVATLVLTIAISPAWTISAGAVTRHALIIGVGSYKEASGLERLSAPANDAEQLKKMLEKPDLGFVTDILKDDDVRDKAAFNAAFQKFLSRVKEKDEVLFYFSGHGFNLDEKGNYFLLPDAKSQPVFLKDLGAAASRDLDTQDKRDRKYKEWMSEVALSEAAIEKSIADRRAEVIVIIADACRNLISGAKGAALVASGLGLPRETTRGAFRLYAASKGQISLDSPARSEEVKSQAGDKPAGKKGDSKKDEQKSLTSLFTRVLLSELEVPRQEINILAAKVKISVRDQARKLGKEQVPDFSDDPQNTKFYFWQGDTRYDLEARCQTAKAELAQLRYGVASGSVSAADLEDARIRLAPCDFAEDIERLSRLQSNGAGALSTLLRDAPATGGDPNDAAQQCDLRAASLFDPNRPQNIGGTEIQKVAMLGLSGGADERSRAAREIQQAIDFCTRAITERSRVARYKYNLARAYYALASLSAQPLGVTDALERASLLYEEAADLGYAAAYNDLALLYQNGEYRDRSGTRLPVNRGKALELFRKGADLGHVLALYNLGMAQKNGDLGLVSQLAETKDTEAFRRLSKAAEAGFVPATIETALYLKKGIPGTSGLGIQANPKRAIEMMEIAASRGSWEAMYQLGEMYSKSNDNEAIIWYARAAEAGDTRSQARLANLMSAGHGLPAPQPEAAGRFLRLAADGGSIEAMFDLANRLRDGKIPFRPRLDGKPDGGAKEIADLYRAAFALGNPKAGLELARLYRTGFPADRPSDALPKDPERAIDLLLKVIERVRSAPTDSAAADPMTEYYAGFELIKMYDAGEAKRKDGTPAIFEDQIDLLRADYGDGSKILYIWVGNIWPVACNNRGQELWVAVWDWKRPDPPTETQFDWFERFNKCKERGPADKRKEEDLGVTLRIRDVFRKELQASRDPKAKEKRSFVDRMASVVDKASKGSAR